MDTRIYEGILPDRAKKIDIFIKNSTASMWNDYLRVEGQESVQFYQVN